MKPFTAFLLGAGLMLVIGATTDDSLHKIANSLERIARSCEIIAQQRNKP